MRRWFVTLIGGGLIGIAATVYAFGTMGMVGNHHLKAWALYLVGLALACTGLWWILERNR